MTRARRLLLLAMGALLGCSGPSAGSPPAASSSAPVVTAAATATTTPTSAPATTATAATTASATVDESEAAPSAAALPPDLVARATSYPDKLTSSTPPPPLSMPLFSGRILWIVNYDSTADRSHPFTILLCDRTCDIRYPLPPTPALSATASGGVTFSPDVLLTVGAVLERPLGASRTVALRTLGMGLGGAMVTARWQSPGGRFEVVAMMNLSPHDIPLTKAARAFQDAHQFVRTMESLAAAADAALWPPK